MYTIFSMNKLELIALPLILSLLVSAGFAVSTSYAQGNQTNATSGNMTGGNQTGNQSGGPLGQLGEALGGLMGGGQ